MSWYLVVSLPFVVKLAACCRTLTSSTGCLANALQFSGVASEVRTEVRLGARRVDGSGLSHDSDVIYFEPDGRRALLECSRLAITQSSIAGSGALAGPSAVSNFLQAKENA